MKTVPTTILEQLGGNKFIAMTGAKQFYATDNGFKFRLPSRFAKDGINSIVITLSHDDTYRIEFWKIRGVKCDVVSSVDGVYNDNLRSVFTSHTGLDCTL